MKTIHHLTRGAIIAALYVALTMVSSLLGLSSGAIQLRLSEALTILPMFTPAAIPGLFLGCALANLLTGASLLDVIFGSLATLLGALGTRFLAKSKWMGPIFPIVANTITVPLILKLAYGLPGSLWFYCLTVLIGEVLSCGVLGVILYNALEGRPLFQQ